MTNEAIVYCSGRKLFVEMTFGNWLRAKIIEAHTSNAELARRVGVSPTHIGNLVRDYSPNTKSGKGKPSEEVLEKIALVLGADVDEARLAAGFAPRNAEGEITITLPDGMRI